MRLDRAVAWPIETRGGRVDVPLAVRFFAPAELEVVDGAANAPRDARGAPDAGRALAVLRDVLAPRLAAAGFALEEDVTDDDEIGCLEYRSGPPTDPLALAVTHLPGMPLIRAELWRPRRLLSTGMHGWHVHEETWRLVPDADPYSLACQVAATVGRWLDGRPAPSRGVATHDDGLARWIGNLRDRLERGDLADTGPIDVGYGTGGLRGETTIRIMLNDLGDLEAQTEIRDGDAAWYDERRRTVLDDFRRLRELID